LLPHDAFDPRRFFDAIARRYDRVYALDRDASRARMARVVRAIAEEAPDRGARAPRGGEAPHGGDGPARSEARTRVLDLGVGTGRELGALQDAGLDVLGLDFSPAMLALCARRARPVPLVEADLWAPLPFDAGSFDAVIALHGTLAHPPDDGALASLVVELARVLTPRGVFVAEVPSPRWLDAIDASASSGTGAAAGAGGDPRRFAARRTGERAFVHEDAAAGVSIAARVLDAPAWTALFAPRFTARVEPISEVEQLVVCWRIG